MFRSFVIRSDAVRIRRVYRAAILVVSVCFAATGSVLSAGRRPALFDFPLNDVSFVKQERTRTQNNRSCTENKGGCHAYVTAGSSIAVAARRRRSQRVKNHDEP